LVTRRNKRKRSAGNFFKVSNSKKYFYTYIVSCADGTFYTGYTNDVNARIDEHNGLTKKPGAKYTKARRPVKLVYSEKFDTKSEAMKREWEIKQMNRVQKQELL
jgi:putative endonuclease